MAVSVCLVTRNEAENIERAVRSVAGLGAEVVVADTGSTDRTAEHAAAAGARVVDVGWDDDFAAARNAALDHAAGDWVLWLNPDEELLPASASALTAATARPEALAYHVRVQEVGRADRPDEWVEMVQPRLFRRRPDLRFQGRTHPHFTPPLEELAARLGLQVGLAAVTLRHHAYLSVPTSGKVRWANRLLKRELQDRPGQLFYLIEYGRNLLLLNDPEGHAVLAEAAREVVPLRAEPRPPHPAVQRLLEYLLTADPAQVRGPLSRDDARELARRWFPASPPLLWADALHDFRRGAFAEAAATLARLLEMGRTGRYDRSQGFDPAIVGRAALMNLGTCQARLGRLAQAAACFRSLLADPAAREQAAAHLAALESLRPPKPAP